MTEEDRNEFFFSSKNAKETEQKRLKCKVENSLGAFLFRRFVAEIGTRKMEIL